MPREYRWMGQQQQQQLTLDWVRGDIYRYSRYLKNERLY